ncbi:MAG: dTDP-4-dehydrorhamnose reductase [Deltaproteobacteria bacterium]|nr:MAG: dTDP-4-dehydrorhamnose reductase [Deltaproteobacteria bacterium]
MKEVKSSKPRLMLVGARGQLGFDCQEIFSPSYNVKSFSSSELDLAQLDSIDPVVFDFSPEVIINAAAYTKVDACETDIERALLVNAEAPARLAVAARDCGALLVQVSTDYVFSGDRVVPQGYVEDDAVAPVSVYGRSKLAGEEAVAASGCEYLIVRTAWLYGINGHNFLKTMLKLALAGPQQERKVVADQFGCLTWSRTLAQQLLNLVESGRRGLYHAVAEGSANWFQVASRFLELMEVEHCLVACTTSEYPTPARRPANSILLNRKLKDDDLLLMRSWQEDLELFVIRYRDQLLEEVQQHLGT